MPNSASFRYGCPHCRKTMSVPERLRGKTIKCPNTVCGKPIAFPVAVAELPEELPLELPQKPRKQRWPVIAGVSVLILVGASVGAFALKGKMDADSTRASRASDAKSSAANADPARTPVDRRPPLLDETGRRLASKTLSLVSLAYSLNGKEYSRDHDLHSYLPLIQSAHPEVREVAALSAVWELQTVVVSDAHQARIDANENFLGMKTPVPKGAESETRAGVVVPKKIFGVLSDAGDAGALRAYREAPFWASQQPRTGTAGGPASVGDFQGMLGPTVEYYQAQLTCGLMQQILWNRAEELGRSLVERGNGREADVEVRVIFPTGDRWGNLVIKNRSQRSIRNVSFAMIAPTKALVQPSPKFDVGVGGLTAVLTGEDDPRRVAVTAKQFADGVAAERAIEEIPPRIFAHISELKPGDEWEIRDSRFSMNFSRTKAAYFSLWADDLALENRPLPGYAEQKNPAPKPKPLGEALDPQAEVVARWKHLENNITLYSNGKINNPAGDHTWSKAADTLTLRWKDPKAPGGFWIDTCTISPDGQSFKGTNQLRRPIAGTLVKDPSLANAKGGEKTNTAAKPAASVPDRAADAENHAEVEVLLKLFLAGKESKEFIDVATQNQVDRWKESAGWGNADGQYLFGRSVEEGARVPKNPAEAAKLFHKAADQGHALAQRNLALCYVNGDGVAANLTEAVKWYRKAADQGFVAAQTDLGLCYMMGMGLNKDATEAARWWRKAADQGYAKAQTNIGWCYGSGTGVPKDRNQAVKWFRQAADQGDSLAQRNLASCYVTGDGVAANLTEAVKWYRKAADQGEPVAQNQFGVCYEEGLGVTKNLPKAAEWYLKGAQAGDETAMYNISRCYGFGLGVAVDRRMAQMWLTKSAAAGFAPARTQIALNQAQRWATLIGALDGLGGGSGGNEATEKEEAFRAYIRRNQEQQRLDNDQRIREREQGRH